MITSTISYIIYYIIGFVLVAIALSALFALLSLIYTILIAIVANIIQSIFFKDKDYSGDSYTKFANLAMLLSFLSTGFIFIDKLYSLNLIPFM